MKKKKYYSSPTIEVFYCHLEMLLADTTIETSPGGPSIGHGGEGDIEQKGGGMTNPIEKAFGRNRP